MILHVGAYFAEKPILVVGDSWFGNNGLCGHLQQSEQHRAPTLPFAQQYSPVNAAGSPRQTSQGRPRKYGHRWESVGNLAASFSAIRRGPIRCYSMASSVRYAPIRSDFHA